MNETAILAISKSGWGMSGQVQCLDRGGWKSHLRHSKQNGYDLGLFEQYGGAAPVITERDFIIRRQLRNLSLANARINYDPAEFRNDDIIEVIHIALQRSYKLVIPCVSNPQKKILKIHRSEAVNYYALTVRDSAVCDAANAKNGCWWQEHYIFSLLRLIARIANPHPERRSKAPMIASK